MKIPSLFPVKSPSVAVFVCAALVFSASAAVVDFELPFSVQIQPVLALKLRLWVFGAIDGLHGGSPLLIKFMSTVEPLHFD